MYGPVGRSCVYLWGRSCTVDGPQASGILVSFAGIGPAVTIIFIFCEVLARANEIADALSCLTNVAEEYIKFVANTAE